MGTTTPKRQAILEALRDRLEAITTANGFRTNAGQTVCLGETPALGPDDATVAIAIVVGDDEPRFQGEHVFVSLPIGVQALAQADLDDPYLAIEAVLGDIKEAVELEDRTLGGLVPRSIDRGSTRTLEREPGSTTVGVELEYSAPYTEVWGAP